MTREADPWAKEWLAKMRSDGSKGLTIEKKRDSHYVYWATTEWDKASKKRKKISEYLGILEPPGNLVVSADIDVGDMDRRAIDAAHIDVERYTKRPPEVVDFRPRGPMLLFERFGSDLYTGLKRFFPETSDDLMMLAMARLAGRGRLCQAGDWFGRQDNVMGLNPHTDPSILSDSLRKAGGSTGAQNAFFGLLKTNGKKMAVDMTVCFNKGRAFLIKKGYNRFRLDCGQFKMVVICGLEDKLPQSLTTVAGDVKEGCITDILKTMNVGTDCILVMDRGYASEEIMDTLHFSGYRFVIPVKRDSKLYDTVKVDPGLAFRYHGSTVLFGEGEGYGYKAYRYENMSLREQEIGSKVLVGDEDDLDSYRIGGDVSRAGNLILVSNLNELPPKLYTMFKMRSSVEECNDSAKNVMAVDSAYLGDALSIKGYNLVTFLALRMYMGMEAWIAGKGMTSVYTPSDVLFEYSSLVSVVTDKGRIPQKIPPNVRRIEEKLGLGLIEAQ